MKTKILFAVAIVLTAIGCTKGPSEKTIIKGEFLGEAPAEVTIQMPSSEIDTTIAVEENKFTFNLPTDCFADAVLKFNNSFQTFIPDGTVLTFTVDEDNSIKVNSNMQDVSATMWLVEYNEWADSVKSRMQALREIAEKDKDEAMRLRNEIYDEIAEHDLKELDNNANKENLLTSVLLTNLYYSGKLTEEEFEQRANSYSEKFREQKNIKNMLIVIEGKKQTAEGKMFVDFELEQPDGSKVALSDFVGNGKYVLVDFWASWCGPCRAEIPNIAKVYEAHKGDKFDVVSVAVWDKPEDSMAAAKQLNITWNKIYGGDREISSKYGFSGIPFIILFGPDGTILNRGLRGAEIEKTVAACLAKE